MLHQGRRPSRCSPGCRPSYHTLPAPVLALFAGAADQGRRLRAAAHAGRRVRAGAGSCCSRRWAGSRLPTMVAGVLGAAYHWDMRRILAFHIVSQIGYILLAIALGRRRRARGGAVLHRAPHPGEGQPVPDRRASICRAGRPATTCAASAGCTRRGRRWRCCSLVPALSLVGMPPLSGFWAKLLVLREALAQGASPGRRSALAGRRADAVLDDEDLDGGVLEAAPGPGTGACRRQRALAPAWAATVGAGGADAGDRPEPAAADGVCAGRSAAAVAEREAPDEACAAALAPCCRCASLRARASPPACRRCSRSLRGAARAGRLPRAAGRAAACACGFGA
ncbi:MAG: hypothetical protein MZW92_81045 [Comamonadaceae bacterium]|nr:hypothetical protein [Comamonadaceae bacterium]